ncbi:type II toxin-antitoxin system RelE/ParE family toxin [Sphingomonas sp.]|uniref:type II toxin-antitoxin system RelE/ParE family toxin n=1 Tax=Sphingomonas sp. TaxID=28214 RepID=UPI003B00678B
MKDIRWAKLATDDVEAIERWYRGVDQELAAKMLDRIVSSTRLLSDHALAGPIELYGTRRKRRVAGTPYNLFYRVTGDHVRVLRVLHHAQDQSRR